ncbi:MAG: FUSC family protein [Cyclobacteriaceae bacterium]|nr:FUSC family protein [Cyclobacteriaceae bacterium]MDH4295988.1 FUSC family protein [Cyclobacteriaceae bacterium]MDH5250291.1 FUSC family protein [Cyclobacteriaceae bacterium]
MQYPNNYLQEIQRFTTSQYWNSGVRITTGVMVPLLIMANQGWLSVGTPFLFGALFVSLTDTPGPIHHRRNGMLAAIGLNTFTVFITGLTYHHPALLLSQVAIFSFLLSLLGIYGARAGAIGTLAIVIMLIQMSPLRQEQPIGINALLTAGGGLWYASFSLLLNRLQPYRLVDQALGENLMLIAAYVRARASLYTMDTELDATFNLVMQKQVDVLKAQNQLREVLFKTRQFVGDPSPKSRSVMMIFLESLDLFEEAMYSYLDYTSMKEHISPTLLEKCHMNIVQLAVELEHIGLSIQAGIAVKKMPSMDTMLDALEVLIKAHMAKPLTALESQSMVALQQTGQNIRGMVSRLRRIARYTRMEAYDPNRFPDQELEKPPATDPFSLTLLAENFTFRANHFRYAIRITSSMMIGYGISAFFALSHAYWVMLTVITILKPVYNLTRVRNIQRVLGTLGGVVLGSVILFAVSNTTVLIIIMIFCMVLAYSLLRVNYLGFVIFLTTYILITFHFLNPVQFKNLIGERLIDTLIGSAIAALAARFIFPVWQQYNIHSSMTNMLTANTAYFLAAWNALQHPSTFGKQYNAARNEAIVNLTNLSDNFQQMLAEPGQSRHASAVHQFVIANLTLTSRISALTAKDLVALSDSRIWSEKITDTLAQATRCLASEGLPDTVESTPTPTLPSEAIHTFSTIYSLAHDIKRIAKSVSKMEED